MSRRAGSKKCSTLPRNRWTFIALTLAVWPTRCPKRLKIREDPIDETRGTRQPTGEKPAIRILAHPRAWSCIGGALSMEVAATSRRLAQSERDDRYRTSRAARDQTGKPASAAQINLAYLASDFFDRQSGRSRAGAPAQYGGNPICRARPGRLYGGRWREIFHGRGRSDSHAQLDLARPSQRVARPDYLAGWFGWAVDSIVQCSLLRRRGIS